MEQQHALKAISVEELGVLFKNQTFRHLPASPAIVEHLSQNGLRTEFTEALKEKQSTFSPKSEKVRGTHYTDLNVPRKLAQRLAHHPAYRHGRGPGLCRESRSEAIGVYAHRSFKIML